MPSGDNQHNDDPEWKAISEADQYPERAEPILRARQAKIRRAKLAAETGVYVGDDDDLEREWRKSLKVDDADD